MFGWQIRLHAFVTFHTIQLVKGTPFQEEAPRIGHYRAYPLGAGGGGGMWALLFVVVLKSVSSKIAMPVTFEQLHRFCSESSENSLRNTLMQNQLYQSTGTIHR